MKLLLASLLAVVGPTVAMAASWHTDYAKAWELATTQDKPILVCFTDNQTAVTANVDALPALADQFVCVLANRNAPVGKRLYSLFEMQADRGVVVIEKDHQFQYARVERDLNKSEMETLLTKTANVRGKPTSDVLAVSAQEVVPASTASNVTMPSETYFLPQSATGSYCPNCRRR